MAETFELDGKTYTYHEQKNCPYNERRVEVTLGLTFLGDTPNDKILEVGNVTRLYSKRQHPVIDLNEKHKGWKNYENLDVLTYFPKNNLDRVLSISTLEHTQDMVKAIQNCLMWSPNCLITYPIGYQTPGGITTNEATFHNYGDITRSFMVRHPLPDVPEQAVGRAGVGSWKQVPQAEIQNASFEKYRWGHHFYLSAHAICIMRKVS